ncbi:MAG: YdbH domain-containing protein [Rhodospirillum sp.]|nr:YdbH domain-containing protein [Rhodospirillum sp.]
MTRRGRLILGGLLAPPLLLITALALAISLRIPLAEWILRGALPPLGLPGIEGKVRELSLDHVVVENLLVENNQARVKRLTATYSLGGLLSGHVKEVLIEEPTLHGSLDGATPHFPLLDALLNSEDTGPTRGFSPPLDRLETQNTQIILDSTRGPLTVTGDAVFSPLEDHDTRGWSVTLSGKATGPGLEAKGNAAAEISPEGTIQTASGRASGRLSDFSLKGLVDDLSLTADLSGSFNGTTLRGESSSLTLDIGALSPQVLRALPDAARGLLSGPLSLTLGNGERPAALTLDPANESGLGRLSGPLSLNLGGSDPSVPGRGRVTVTGLMDLALPGAFGIPDPARMSGSATITTSVTALPIEGLAETMNGVLTLALALDGAGGATLDLDEGSRVQVERLAPALAEALDALGPHDRPSLTLVQAPTHLRRFPDGRIEAAGAMTLQPMANDAGRATLSFTGLSLPNGDAWAEGGIQRATLSLTALNPPGASGLSGDITLANASWTATEASGRVTSDLTAGSLAAKELSLGGLRQQGRATLRWESTFNRLTADPLESHLSLETLNNAPRILEGLTLDWRGGLSLAVDSGLIEGRPEHLNLALAEGTLGEGVTLTAPLSLSLSAPTTFTARTDRGQVTLAKTKFAPTTLALTVNGEALSARNLAMSLSGPWPPGPGSPLVLALSEGALHGFGLSTRALMGTFTLEEGGPKGTLSALVDQLPGEVKPAKGARPLTLDLSLSHPEPGADNEHFPLRARLTDPQKRLSIGLEGWTTATLAEGRLGLAARPVTFTPKGLQPDAIHAALGGIAKDVTGTLALKGILSWRGSTLSPDLSILAKDVTATLGDVPMEKINGVIRLTQFWPPRGPTQDISVGTVNLGLPLGNALIRYTLDGEGHLIIENASLALAGGSVTTENVTVPLKGGQILVPLEVKAIALDQLAGLTNLDGLAASGSLGGRIPLRVEPDGTIWVDKATLETEASGHLRYHPPEAPEVLAAGNQGVLLLLLALDDFQYEHLKLTLDGESSGELTIGINLLGANPDLYDGYPVDLHVTLTGALTELIRKNLRTYTLPSRIQDNLEQFMNSLGYTGATAPTVP